MNQPKDPPRPRSFVATRFLALALTTSVAAASVTACGGPGGTERWVATENTNVEIDWDAINQAYRDAEGPEDFEKRVNEIYTGDEIISVSVRDVDDKSQVVTGFFDNNEDGQVAEDEKVFTIQRDIVDPEKAQYAINGHGAYGHYHSPMWDIASGMLMGSMLSRMFMPGYSPMYRTPYTTSPASRSALASHRSTFRAANPAKFQKASGSGRTYGRTGGSFGSGTKSTGTRSGGRVGGGRFGVRRPAGRKVVALS
jgi:hypothetical protein